MKKITPIIVTLALAALSISQAFADNTGSACPPSGSGFHNLCLSATQLGSVVGSFITFAFVIIGFVALGWLVFGGFKWLTSQGEKQAVEEARNHIVAAIIGLIIIFLSYLVVNLLLSFLTNGQVSLTSGINLPTLGQP